MKKFIVLIALLLLVVACKPNLESGLEEEGDFAVIDDSENVDIFEQIEALEEEPVEVEEVVEATEEPEVEVVMEEPEEVVEEPRTTRTESGVFKVTVDEGELVKVDLDVEDPDGDQLTLQFERPLDANGEWQTEMGDDGKYYTTVVVSDGDNDVEVDVLIEVLSVNEDPILDRLSDVEVDEGDTIRLQPSASDADGDDLTYSYSGDMTSATWSTDFEDAGRYEVTVTVEDGNGGSDSQTVTVVVNDVNRAPVIKGLE